MEDRLEATLIEVLRERERGTSVDSEWLAENYPHDGEEVSTILALEHLLRGPDTDVVRLGPYELCGEIGRGGMGTVFRAVVVGRAPDLAVGDVVAVKIIHRHLLESPTVFKRLLREAAIGTRIRHPNVVPTFDICGLVVDGDSHHFLVMAHETGSTLRELADERGPLDEIACRRLGAQIADGLGAIHAAGAVHRDVKPANVIVVADDVAKLMDLGVALDAEDTFRLTRTGRFVGTWNYAAPEQFHREVGPVDARSDLYSLGLTLFELVAGRHPFRETRRPDQPPDASERAPLVSESRAGVSREFVTLVASLLEPEPSARPATAASVAAALRG